MTEREPFDPKHLEHDIRLKPGVRLTADPKDYGNTFYWIYAESEVSSNRLQLGIITQEQYDAVFEMDPERNG